MACCSVPSLSRSGASLIHILLIQTLLAIRNDLLPLRSSLVVSGTWSSLYTDINTRLVIPDDVRTFPSIDSDVSGNFKEILKIGDKLLVGSRNALYELNLTDEELSPIRTITWAPTETERAACTRKGKNQDQCENYIRVITPKPDNRILICGTNAYNPTCRTYALTEDGYKFTDQIDGTGLCPFDHMSNNTAVYADGQLFAGTYVKPRDALIYKGRIRTDLYDSKWLNEPNFISSFEYEDKIYYFFQEPAIEYINCGKVVYPRVARVCKNDNGGRMLLMKVWTSFFKSRLNCSVPGEFPFYFNEIQSTSEIGRGHYRSTLMADDTHDMIYAVFSTPENSIPGSAVCAFRMQDIAKTFEGPFKGGSPFTNWMPVKESDTPSPHPAKECHNDSMQIPDNTLRFVKEHPLMDEAVPAFGGQPIFIQASFEYVMTAIAVDWQYRAVDGRRYDIIFTGTNDGRIIKAVNKNRSDKIESTIIEMIEVFDDKSPIIKLQLYRRSAGQPIEHIIAVSHNKIITVSLHRCHVHKDCSSCVGLQDPYCSWEVEKSRCINLISPNEMDTRYFLQSIETGKHSQCVRVTSTTQVSTTTTTTSTVASTLSATCPPCTNPPMLETQPIHSSTPPTMDDKQTLSHFVPEDDRNEIPVVPRESTDCLKAAAIGGGDGCSASKLAAAVLIPSVLFGVIGFLAGYIVSRRCFPQKPSSQHNSESNHKKAENTYSQDPAGPNLLVTSPPYQGVKIYHNTTKKQNNLNRVQNGSVEAIVESQKDNKVYV